MNPAWNDAVSTDLFQPDPTPSRLLDALSNPVRLFIMITITFSVLGGLLQVLGGGRSILEPLALTIVVHVVGNLSASTVAICAVLAVRRFDGSRRRISIRAAVAGGALGGVARLPIEALIHDRQFALQNLIVSGLTQASWFLIAAIITNVTTRLALNEHETRSALIEALRRQTSVHTQLINADVQIRREVAEWLHGYFQTELLLVAEEARRIGPVGAALADRLTDLRQQELRSFAHSLHPTLAEVNLHGALQDLVRRYEATTNVAIDFDAAIIREVLDAEIAVAVYRTCEEAIANAVKHGAAGRIDVTVSLLPEQHGGLLAVSIEDDGSGSPGTVTPGAGLTLIDSYVRMIGGTWDLQFGATGGARLGVTIPIDHVMASSTRDLPIGRQGTVTPAVTARLPAE